MFRKLTENPGNPEADGFPNGKEVFSLRRHYPDQVNGYDLSLLRQLAEKTPRKFR